MPPRCTPATLPELGTVYPPTTPGGSPPLTFYDGGVYDNTRETGGPTRRVGTGVDSIIFVPPRGGDVDDTDAVVGSIATTVHDNRWHPRVLPLDVFPDAVPDPAGVVVGIVTISRGPRVGVVCNFA